MSKYMIVAAFVLLLVSIGAGMMLARRPSLSEPLTSALASIPPAPAIPAPTLAPAPAPKHADLPTVEVAARPVHAVPDGEPPPAKPVTLLTRDGRTIDPSSGRAR